MSINARRELYLCYVEQYQQARRREKARLLDSFIEASGYARKYAIRLLNGPGRSNSREPRPRRRIYPPEVFVALETAWEALDLICAKRLVPFLPELVPKLERGGHLQLSPVNRKLLLDLSAATADRHLTKVRRSRKPRGLSMTKPGAILKKRVPIKTFAEWDDALPGFFEVDLVAHSGPSSSGNFLWTMTLTDVATGWTECVALPNKSGGAVVRALEALAPILPFPVKGLDCDNGSEFLNHEMLGYCEARGITFTRGRAYRKNDQCYVEQKNGDIVRHVTGYARFAGESARRALATLYNTLRVYTNFFQPSMKLLQKTRDGAKVTKKYKTARTPYQRVLEAGCCAKPDAFADLYQALDPVVVLTQLKEKQRQLKGFGDQPPLPIPPALSSGLVMKRASIFDIVQPLLHAWLLAEPTITLHRMLERLRSAVPGRYDHAGYTSLYEYLKRWKALEEELVEQLVVGPELSTPELEPSGNFLEMANS